MSRIRSTSFLTGSVLVSTGVLLPLCSRTDRSLCPVFPEGKEILCSSLSTCPMCFCLQLTMKQPPPPLIYALFDFAYWVKASVTVLPFSHWECFGVELEHSPTKSTKICGSLFFYIGSPTCHSCVTANWNFNFSNYNFCLRSRYKHSHIYSAILSPKTGSLL